jgi:hypothetical protein
MQGGLGGFGVKNGKTCEFDSMLSGWHAGFAYTNAGGFAGQPWRLSLH